MSKRYTTSRYGKNPISLAQRYFQPEDYQSKLMPEQPFPTQRHYTCHYFPNGEMRIFDIDNVFTTYDSTTRVETSYSTRRLPNILCHCKDGNYQYLKSSKVYNGYRQYDQSIQFTPDGFKNTELSMNLQICEFKSVYQLIPNDGSTEIWGYYASEDPDDYNRDQLEIACNSPENIAEVEAYQPLGGHSVKVKTKFYYYATDEEKYSNSSEYFDFTKFEGITEDTVLKEKESRKIMLIKPFRIDSVIDKTAYNILSSEFSTKVYATVTAKDLSRSEYFIECKTATPPKAYVGQSLAQNTAFLNGFSFKQKRWNNYLTETNAIIKDIHINLNGNYITPKVFSKENTNIEFNYSYNDNSAKYTSTTPIVQLASKPFDYIVKTTNYYLEDVINTDSLNMKNPNSSLVYSDGTKISFKDVIFNSEPTWETSLTKDDVGNIFIDLHTPKNFTITQHYDLKYFGKLDYTYTCTVIYEPGVNSAVRGKLVGARHNFNENDTLNYGSAHIDLYNRNDEIVDTINGTLETCPEIVEYPNELGLEISSTNDETIKLFRDGKNALKFKYQYLRNAFNLDWDVYVSYYSDFNIDYSKTFKSYYYKENGQTIDVEDIRNKLSDISITKHTNADSEQKVEEITLTGNDIEIEIPEKIKMDQSVEEYFITLKYTDSFNKVWSKKYKIQVIKVVPDRLQIDCSTQDEESVTYYNNNVDKFTVPVGQVYKLHYNNGTTSEPLTDTYIKQNFEYYRKPDCKEQDKLIPEETTIFTGDGNLIYIKDKKTNVIGSYLIQFIEDKISNIALSSTQPDISFVLGNSYNDIKKQLRVLAIYDSEIQRPLDISEFELLNYDLILEPDTDLQIVFQSKTYNLGHEFINFISPNVSKVEYIFNGFETTFTNLSDTIDCSNIQLKITYENSKYEQFAAFSQDILDTKKNIFNVSSTTTLNKTTPFKFDGSVKIDTEMGVESQISVPLDFTFNEMFSTKTYTTTLDITILEVLKIIGISLKNIKSEYYIGETFLDETLDNTMATIFFETKTGKQEKLDVKLNSNFSAINILPAKGTKFKNVSNNIKVQVSSATDINVRAEYNIIVKPLVEDTKTKIHQIVAVKTGKYTLPNEKEVKNIYLLVDELMSDGTTTTKINELGERVYSNDYAKTHAKVYGYIDDVEKEYINAKVILFDDYIPPIDGSNNIEVTYPCYVEGNADKINHCKIGTLFGSSNTRNRLFVSGNEEQPHIDWHSASIKDNSFGYIEDTSYCVYGETDSAITGYAKVADNKLLVLKSKSDKDSTVWFRVPQMVTAISGSGEKLTDFDGNTFQQEEFALIKGNNSVAGISPKSIVNFNGDTLFVSDEKSVVGLDLVGIIGDNQRYANSRSYYIDWELQQIANKDTWLWSNNKYLFVILNNKIYTTHFEQYNHSSKQYEWLPINIPDVQAILQLDNDIYFGNSKGQLFKFSHSNYDDITKIFAYNDSSNVIVTQGTEDNKVKAGATIMNQLDINKKYKFNLVVNNNDPKDYMYYALGTISNNTSDNFDFYVNAETNSLELRCMNNKEMDFDKINDILNMLDEDKYIYLNHLADRTNDGIECETDGDPLRTYYKKYHLRRVDDTTSEFNCYKLYDEDDNEMNISGLYRAVLCYQLNSEVDIIDIHKETYLSKHNKELAKEWFYLGLNGKRLDLIQYATQNFIRSYNAEIRYYKPVECFYITKPYTMGSLDYFKTIWQSTLTNDTNIPSEIELTYVNNKIPFERMKTISKLSAEALSLDFSDLSFTKFDLAKNIIPRTYTITGIMANLKSITFGFRNYNNTNTVLCSMSIIYSVPTQSYSGD